MLAIIDGDPIVYRAGFAGQSKEYFLVYSFPGDEEIYQDSFPSKKEYNEFIEQQPDIEIIDEWDEITPEPLDHVLHTVKLLVRECTTATAKHFDIDVFDVNHRVILSGPGNFRNDIATVRGYKANRKEDHKPYWYQQIRNYLTDQWDAEVVEGREADDECSILAHQAVEPHVICTIDKDLDQVPGWHYDYIRKAFYHTDEDEGHALFYKQILTGDSTDNIPGCYKVGKVGAARIVDNIVAEYGMDHRRIWEAIVAEYELSLEKYGEECEYYEKASKEGAEAVAIEMARLVKMQDYPGQLWMPPGQDDELLELSYE